MGATFGGGSSSGTVFGGSGAGNFLSRMTVVAAVIFMLTSMTLAYLSSATGVDSLKVYSSDQKKQAKEKRKTHENILEKFGTGVEGETKEGSVNDKNDSSESTPEADETASNEETNEEINGKPTQGSQEATATQKIPEKAAAKKAAPTEGKQSTKKQESKTKESETKEIPDANKTKKDTPVQPEVKPTDDTENATNKTNSAPKKLEEEKIDGDTLKEIAE